MAKNKSYRYSWYLQSRRYMFGLWPRSRCPCQLSHYIFTFHLPCRVRDTLILLLHFFSDFPTRQDFRFQAANLATSCIFHLLAYLILRRIFQNRKRYKPMTRISKCAMLYLKFISKYYFFSVSLREIRIFKTCHLIPYAYYSGPFIVASEHCFARDTHLK